ncbi:MAG TPA: LytR/AlgR family response regulator transcription factor [Cyclobacteriaceae bacterium]
MITCIAIDDDSLFLITLEAFIDKIPNVELLDKFESPVDGAQAIVKLKPDLVLLDYEMPYLNGFETLEMLDKKPKIMVISGHNSIPEDKEISVDYFMNKLDLKEAKDLEKAINELFS